MLEKVNVEGLGISLSSAEEKIEVVASRESVLLMMAGGGSIKKRGRNVIELH